MVISTPNLYSLLEINLSTLPLHRHAPPQRRKQTARKFIGTSTQTSAEKESLKLKRTERTEVKRVKTKAEKDTGNAVRPKASRGVRGRRGGQGGVRSDQRGVPPEPDNVKEPEVEARVSNGGFDEYDGINLEEVCQCEGISGREPKDDTFDVDFYIEAYSL